ncbi:MAG TPA: transcriptional repressor [Pyrinomonadaceae bacterium]
MSKTKAKEAREVLRQKLDERGLSMTSQRAAVYDYLGRVSHHPTAEEIFLQIKGELPKISLATVYKNLEALAACGAITKLGYGDASARYDVRTDRHYHARCTGCGRIWDVEAGADAAAFERLKPPAGFRVEEARLEVVGRCRDCAR